VEGQFVRSCCFIGNDAFLLVGNSDGTVALFNLKGGNIISSKNIVETDQQSNILYAVNSFRSAKKVLNFLTCHEDNLVKRWAVGAKCALDPQKVYKGHFASVRYACSNLAETELLTCCVDHSARIWDEEKMNTKLILAGHKDSCSYADFIDDKTVITASWDQTLKIFKLPETY